MYLYMYVVAFTSFQSLHRALTSGVRGPDLFAQLLDDGQQLCIFVLRHLAAAGALKRNTAPSARGIARYRL